MKPAEGKNLNVPLKDSKYAFLMNLFEKAQIQTTEKLDEDFKTAHQEIDNSSKLMEDFDPESYEEVKNLKRYIKFFKDY